MSAFEDYCIVCDKQCAPNSVYCSEKCRHIDEERSASTTRRCSYNTNRSSSLTTPALVPKGLSPLLTPQFMPDPTPSNAYLLDSQNLDKRLSYESPILACSSCRDSVNDLDANKLDLNASDSSYYTREISSAGVMKGCASENYRKWLSTH